MSSWARVLLLVVCAGCAGAGASRRGDGDEAGTVRQVAGVEIVGNRQVSDGDLIAGLATRPPRGLIFRSRTTYDPVALQLDLRRVEAYYKEHGWFAARVVGVDVKAVGRDAVRVTIHVEEGEPTRITAVQIDGVPARARAAAHAVTDRLEPGEVLVHPVYLEAKEILHGELVRRGYAHAVVDGVIEVDRDRREAIVRLSVDAGPPVRFGRVRVRGLGRVPERAVRARLAWEEGDPFDPDALALTQGRLYELGVFSSVRLDYDREGRPEVADVTIHVAEGARHEVRLGGGGAVDRVRWELHARGGYTVRGFPHPLTTIRLDARPAYTFLRGATGDTGLGGEATAVVEQEDLFLPRMRGTGELGYTIEEIEAYSTRGPRLRLGLGRPLLGDRLHVGVGWQIRSLDFFRVDDAIDDADAATFGLVEPYRLAFFEQSLAYDRRDHPTDAHRGYFADLRLEEGGGFAGGKFRYTKGTTEARGYLPVGRRVVLAARTRVGIVVGGQTLPITQRYYAGGASSHRGFPYRRLSPVATAGDGHTVPVGGEALVETSAEARIDVFRFRGRWIGVAAFIDGADVTRDAGDLDPFDLHWATGLGLRYDTPVGPLRFDVGYRLNRTGAGDPEPGERWAWHVSLGEAF